MRLLLDENLSPRMVSQLRDAFEHIDHVRDVGLSGASDEEIRRYALAQEAMIVTRDSDFNDLVMLRGWPPKVLWLRIGNATPEQLMAVLRTHATAIAAFAEDPGAGLMTIAGDTGFRIR